MIDLKGKVALVTGGGAGIGRGIVEAFGRCGARLVVAERDEGRTAQLQQALDAAGVEALVRCCDVTEPAPVRTLLREVDERHGGLDILVNNVGDFLGIAKPFERLTDEEQERLYAVNLRQVFDVTRAALPLLRRRAPGGSIITLSSIEGFRGIPMCTVYSAFKAALTGFTKSLALELAPAGIRVNAIAPETTETLQTPVSMLVAPEHRERVRDWIPLGRFGKPEDSAGCALFLASELSAWVTGTALHPDGGALAAGGWYRDPKGIWTNLPVIAGNGFNFG